MDEQLLSLFASISRQAARMEIMALRAQRDQRPDLLGLYQALEKSYQAQARRTLLQLRGRVSNSEANLAGLIERELPPLVGSYERLGRQAAQEERRAITTACDQAARIGRMNQNLARQRQQSRRDNPLHVCNFCGFIASDQPPEHCPICTAPSHRFERAAP
ncbi:rubredoxin-like domain-containing protein [Desulfogranum mediterraneum]|uniref:rubredoxin-like domain-containing protein n=1 Tax=Desulfogranum mediterraneum TaxID=160661 RepID=UPI0004207EA8|nr:rubrerythrin family protein [Desulfogranum mediterraneum]